MLRQKAYRQRGGEEMNAFALHLLIVSRKEYNASKITKKIKV